MSLPKHQKKPKHFSCESFKNPLNVKFYSQLSIWHSKLYKHLGGIYSLKYLQPPSPKEKGGK